VEVKASEVEGNTQLSIKPSSSPFSTVQRVCADGGLTHIVGRKFTVKDLFGVFKLNALAAPGGGLFCLKHDQKIIH
jgi:hypothetical protein